MYILSMNVTRVINEMVNPDYYDFSYYFSCHVIIMIKKVWLKWASM